MAMGVGKSSIGGASGFNASVRLLCCVVLTLFEKYWTNTRNVWSLRWMARINPTICLAFVLLFFSTVGSVAQNGLPVADAGPDQTVVSGATVHLDGRGSIGSDRDGPVRGYHWARTDGTEGTSVNLIGVGTAQPSFVADTLEAGGDDVTHVFTLVVRTERYFSSDMVTVTVTAPFADPVADAGPDQTVRSASMVELDGGGSTSDRRRNIMSYRWERTGGSGNSAVELLGATTNTLRFRADTVAPYPDTESPDSAEDTDVTHMFSLIVTDDSGTESVADTVTVTVISPNLPPVAIAGPFQEVASGAAVQLNGSRSSDHDGTISRYNWERVAGAEAAPLKLKDANTARPSFTATTLQPGAADLVLHFELRVWDNEGESATASTRVTVVAPFAVAVANAGPDQEVRSGTNGGKIQLDGSGSTVDRRRHIASYAWVRTGGTDGMAVVLTDANTVRPSFIVEAFGPNAVDVTHKFRLAVTDSAGVTSIDTVTVTVTRNVPPVANAGEDQKVRTGKMVQLDGSGSTADRRGNIASYSWTRTGGTGDDGIVLTGADSALPSFTADTVAAGAEDVTHFFSLVVTDDAGGTSTDMVTVTVGPPNLPPIARTQSWDFWAHEAGTTIPFDGTGSSDPDGTIVSYRWGIVNAPYGPVGHGYTWFEPSLGAGRDPLEGSPDSPTTGIHWELSGADTARAGFRTEPYMDDRFYYWLIVTDNDGAVSAPARGTVYVYREFEETVPDAGPDQRVAPGTTVWLDGRGTRTDPRNRPSYRWVRTGGTGDSSVDLINWDTVRPYFTADDLAPDADDVTHEFTMTAKIYDKGWRHYTKVIAYTDTVTVTVSNNLAPVANAGEDQSVGSRATVQLDGRGSMDDGGTIASYSWTRTGGTGNEAVVLTDANTARPSFLADTVAVAGDSVTHIFSLIVTDGEGVESEADMVTVTVGPPFAVSVADAGEDQTVPSGAEVQLDGSGSTVDRRRSLDYAWERTGGTEGASVALSDVSAAQPNFMTDALNPSAADVIHIFTLTVTDDAGETSTDMVTVTVEAPFAVPVAKAGLDQTVPSGAEVHLNGRYSTTDRRRKIVSYDWRRTGGTGDKDLVLALPHNLNMYFIADTYMPHGVSDVTHEFSLRVLDDGGVWSDADTLTVTVTAAKGADAGPDMTVASGATVQLDGSGSSEGYGTVTNYYWQRTGGSGDSAVVLEGGNTARPSFTADTLDPGADDVTHVFTLDTFVKGHINAVWHAIDTVKVTVASPNAVPVADAGEDQTAPSGSTVQLDGSGSLDRDGTIASFAWTRTGGTSDDAVVLTDATTPQPSFAADALAFGAADVTHVFSLIVTDDEGGESEADTVTVTVIAPNAVPVADAGVNQTVASGAMVELDGSGSLDRDGTVASYSWTRTGGTGDEAVDLTGANTAQLNFTVETLEPDADDVTHVFSLTVTDDEGVESEADTVTVTVTAKNAPPVANAGDDLTVASGATVELDGQGSTDGDGTIATYYWSRVDGSGDAAVILTGANTAQLSFTADALAPGADDVTQVFSLVVTDDDGATSGDLVTVTVAAPNAAPVADAGEDQTVPASTWVRRVGVGGLFGIGTAVHLDGSGSLDRDGEIESYRWERIGGTTGASVNLTGADTAQPSFTTEKLPAGAVAVTHIFSLVVADDEGAESDANTVMITVTSSVAIPVADAGEDKTVGSGATVILDGSGSKPDYRRKIASYAWKRTGGTGASVDLTGADSAQPSFTAETLSPGAVDVTHVFSLIVKDNIRWTSVADKITVTVTSPFAAPVADAGEDQAVSSRSVVELDGSGSISDRRRTISSYAWSRSSGSGSGAVDLTGANTERPRFTAETLDLGAADVTHVFELVVTDDGGTESVADSVTVTVEAPSAAPVADAGENRTVSTGSMVTLDGSGSKDRDGTIASYRWSRTGGTPGASVVLTGADTAHPSFTADTLSIGAADVTHVFLLVVTDNDGVISFDSVTVTVEVPNAAPVADAGADQVVVSESKVLLDGRGSTDRDGSVASYSWTQTGGPVGTPVELLRANTARPAFVAKTLAVDADDVTYVFDLVVIDDVGESSVADTVTVTVIAKPIADAGPDRTVVSGTMVRLDGRYSKTNRYRRIVSYAWTRTGGTTGPSVDLIGADTALPSFTADTLSPGAENAIHIFSLIVTDVEGGVSEADTVTVTVTAGNVPPIADAGDDQTVGAGELVQLDGSGSSDHEGDLESYAWTWTGGTGGSAVVLNDINTVRPSFTAEALPPGAADIVHFFSLVVTDAEGVVSEVDSVTVTVTSGNVRPVADAGDDLIVGAGERFELDGSRSSDNDGTVTFWYWEHVTNANLFVGGGYTPRESRRGNFLTPGSADVTEIYSLIVRDNEGSWSAPDTVAVTVIAPFAAPVADAGQDLTVRFGERVQLDGSGSTSDRRRKIVSYKWRRTEESHRSGSNLFLTDANTARPSYTAVARVHGVNQITQTFSLSVTDDAGVTSETDSVVVTVTNARYADAGPDQVVCCGGRVTLDGSRSLGAERWRWRLVGGFNFDDDMQISGYNTARPSFTPGYIASSKQIPDRTWIFELTIWDDGYNWHGKDRVLVRQNDRPIANAGADQKVDSGAEVQLDGSKSGDRSGWLTSHTWTRTGGTGDAALVVMGANTVQPSFTADTLAVGAEDVTHIFDLIVTDNFGFPSIADTVTVTVESPFVAPVADAGEDQKVASEAEVQLDGSSSTSDDRSNLDYVWMRTHGTEDAAVALSDASSEQPSFTADTLAPGAADVMHEFTLTVTDDAGVTSTDTVMVTVEAPFAVPVADAGENQTVASGEVFRLDGSGSTSDRRRSLDYAWTRTGGTEGATVDLSDASAEQPSITDTLAPGAFDATHEFTLTVTDDAGETSADTVTVTVKAQFARPVADAGPDLTIPSGSEFQLVGGRSTSDRRREIVAYRWERTGGTVGATAVLDGANSARPSFNTGTLRPGVSDVTHILSLIVTDNKGVESVPDTMTVTVAAAKGADAGPNLTVASGTLVELDGSGSSEGYGTVTNYYWTYVGGNAGSSVVLTDASTARPSFTAETLPAGAGDLRHIFELATFVKGDNSVNWFSTDLIMVTITSPHVAPVANAGEDQTFASGALVELDGSGSTTDSRGHIDTYAWTRRGGSGDDSLVLTGANTAHPSFTAETLSPGAFDVTHTFSLIVTDGEGVESEADTVTVTIAAPNADPVANAGDDQTVASGEAVQLDGGGSLDRDGTVASYSWSRTGGTPGVSLALTSADTVQSSFTADTVTPGAADVTHILLLLVTDNEGGTSGDFVKITVTAPFAAPVAHAGDDLTVASETTVQLDGSSSTSDRRRRITSYSWSRTGGTGDNALVLTGADTAHPSFDADTLPINDDDVTHEFTLTVTDDADEISTDTVTVTVEAPFAAPVADAGDDQTVASQVPVQLDGTGSTSDRRRSLDYAWSRTGGTEGVSADLADASTARPSFTADTVAPGALDVIHEFTLTVTDDAGETSSDTVMVAVEAPFAAPVADAGEDQTVASEGAVELDGSGSTSDRRRSLDYAWSRTGGTEGASVDLIDASAARPHFTADRVAPGADDVTHEFTLTVTDDAGETSTDTKMVTVEAPFAAPVVDAGDDQTVASGATVQLAGSDSIPDRRRTIASYAWTRTGGTEGASVDLIDASAARSSFKADALEAGALDVIHEFTLTVTDDADVASADTVTVTVTAPFAAPVAEAGGDQRVATGATVQLDGSGSTSDRRRSLDYAWTRTGGTEAASVDLVDAATAHPSFTADTLAVGAGDVIHVFLLVVTDSDGLLSFDTVTVTVEALNDAPVADAGPDRTVVSGATVTLDGSGSKDDDGTIVSYHWERTGGTSDSSVVLADSGTAQASFTADALDLGASDVTHIFTLTVTDDQGETSTARVTVTVAAPRAAPVADAGSDQTVASGATVTLDGTGSVDGDGTIVLSYHWSRTGGTSGTSVVLTDAKTAQPSFTADILDPGAIDVTHAFLLVVTDNYGVFSVDTVMVTVEAPNAAPVANAGADQTVASGATVALDGSGSEDPDGTITAFGWVRTGGTEGASATLVDAIKAEASFTADALEAGAQNVTHEFTLTVTDDLGDTSTDTVAVTVIAPFAAPVADAGEEQTIASGTSVTLDGSGSTVDHRRTIASYGWIRTSGTGGLVTLSDASAVQPTFTAETLEAGAEDVTHVFTLTVTDSVSKTSADTVTVTVNAPFAAPVAEAGPDQTVASGATVQLDGGGSTTDRRRSIASYSWTRSGGSGDDSLTPIGANIARSTFKAESLEPGSDDVTHIFTLIVTDDFGDTSADTMEVTVFAPDVAGSKTENLAPVANAGSDQTVDSGSEVILNGSSEDNDGTVQSYAWIRTGGSGDSGVALTGATTAQLSFTADILATSAEDVTHIFQLVVVDDAKAVSAPDTVAVTVTSPFATPVADAGDDQSVHSGRTVTLNGSRSIKDRRRTISYSWERTSGTGGSVTLSNASSEQPTFTADTIAPRAADVTHVFTLTVTDSAGEKATDSVTITITSPFVAPVADAGRDLKPISETKVTLDGRGSTGDHRATLTYAWTRTGGSGDSNVVLTGADTAQPSFTADTLEPGADAVTHEFTLTVMDNGGSPADTDTVTVTVVSAFMAPVAYAGDDQTVASGVTARLDGRGSTADHRSDLDYFWSRTGGTQGATATLTGAKTAQPRFTANTLKLGAEDVTHIFTLTVTDDGNGTATDTVTITVIANALPVADAGADRTVDTGTTVTLIGSGMDDEGTVQSYTWTRIGGTGNSGVALTGATTAQLSFTADSLAGGAEEVTHIFQLVVTDDLNAVSAPDTVKVTVVSAFVAAVADAGDDQTVAFGATVRLDGRGSTADHRSDLDYFWSRTGGTQGATATLTGAKTAQPRFTANTLEPGAEDVTHIFTLTVMDDGDGTATDTVTITVIANALPVADAGADRTVDTGTTVILNGSGTDDEGTVQSYTYTWTRIGGTGNSRVALTGATTAQLSFTADSLAGGTEDVTHIFQLVVTDDVNAVSAPDTVKVTVTSPFATPRANAGSDQEMVLTGTQVTLDGSGSEKDRRRTIESYSWVRTSGTGASNVVLTGANTVGPTFTADALADGTGDVTHVFELTVTDSAKQTSTDTVTITVISRNAAPVAVVGADQTAASGTQVTLDGSGSSDSEGTISYSWARTGGTTGASVALSGANTPHPTFTADSLAAGAADVRHVFTLTVTDKAGDTDTATVTVTVNSPFAAPVAIAGPDQEVRSRRMVTLDGIGSTKDRRATLTYSWARTGGTENVSVTLSDPNSPRPSFTADTLAVGADDVKHEFTLTVTDDLGSSADTDLVTVTVIPPSSENEAPIADRVEHRSVASGATVTLYGSGTDYDGTVVSYEWTRTGGTGNSGIVLTGADTAELSFTTDTLSPGSPSVIHNFTLVVTDDKGARSEPESVSVTVVAPFKVPVADAGPDQTVVSGATVRLDGTGSTTDFRRSIASYEWLRSGGTEGVSVVLTGAKTAQPTFTAETPEVGDADVIHVFTLAVRDNAGVWQAVDTVTVTVVIAPQMQSSYAVATDILGEVHLNISPIAEAGDDQVVASGEMVHLDGSESSDLDGSIVAYSWNHTGGTVDSTVALTEADTAQPSFMVDALAPGADDVSYVFSLTVTDDQGAVSVADAVTVTVSSFTVSSPALVEANILVSSSNLTVQEGGSSAYQVKLSESPGQEEVIIEAVVSDNEDVVLENARISFSAENWDTWQNVSASAVSDADNTDDKALIRHRFVGDGVEAELAGDVSVTVREREVDPFLRTAGEYLETRATVLINNQPGLSRFLKDDGTIPNGTNEFMLKATNGQLALDGGFVRNGIWGELSSSYTRTESGDLKSAYGSFGIHRKYSERFLAGVMLQFDLAENDLGGDAGSIDGTGWLVGPYFAARHGSQPLYFEGRLLYGQSDNDFRFNDPAVGERTGSFDTRRLLARLRMEGEMALSVEDDGFRLIPYADVRWVEERAAAFTDRIGIGVRGQKVRIGQLELGSNVEVPIALTHGTMTFTGGLGVVYSNSEGDYISSGSRGQGRGEIGLSYVLDDNVQLDFESFYDGIGTSEIESYGLSLSAEMKF